MSQPTEKVVDLRRRTGAGMMDCKNAIEEACGDVEKAIEILRTKGIAKAAKKAERPTANGVVESYIHPGERLGVLIEVDVETDFVARNQEFRRFVRDLAMLLEQWREVERKRNAGNFHGTSYDLVKVRGELKIRLPDGVVPIPVLALLVSALALQIFLSLQKNILMIPEALHKGEISVLLRKVFSILNLKKRHLN